MSEINESNRTYLRQTVRRRMQAFGLQIKRENEWYEGLGCDGGRKVERSGNARCPMARAKRRKLVKRAASLRQNGDHKPTSEGSNSTCTGCSKVAQTFGACRRGWPIRETSPAGFEARRQRTMRGRVRKE